MKKGFTLVEVLAVIVIISLITILVMPNLLNSVNNKRQNISDSAKQMIYDAADIYVKENSDNYPNTSGINYCIKLEDLVNSGKLVSPVKDMKTDKEIPLNYYINVTVNDYSQFEYELVEKCQLKKCTELVNNVWTYDYTGNSQVFTVPCEGNYKIETWGAEGGYSVEEGNELNHGGYGAYSVGNIKLTLNNDLYIVVGGKGTRCQCNSSHDCCGENGGYNGGGKSTQYYGGSTYYGSGGGATHIATKNGLLTSLEKNKDSILIVAAGGGGASNWQGNSVSTGYNWYGGSGGGIIGMPGTNTRTDRSNSCTGGTQTNVGTGEGMEGISFGAGGYRVLINNTTFSQYGPGGGGGYYGGGTSETMSCGGSSYIGNANLVDKHMTCYNCTTSDVETTKTISNECHNFEPKTDCSKEGNGYAKITYLGE